MDNTAKRSTHSQLLKFGMEGSKRDNRETMAWKVGDLSASLRDKINFLCAIE